MPPVPNDPTTSDDGRDLWAQLTRAGARRLTRRDALRLGGGVAALALAQALLTA